MFAAMWKRPPFGRGDAAADNNFMRVIKLVAEACEADELPTAIWTSEGLVKLFPPIWHILDWHKYFWRGEITIYLSELYGAGHAGHEEFFIFVARRHLDPFVAKQAAQPDEPDAASSPSAPEAQSEMPPSPVTEPDEPTIADPRTRDQVLLDYFRNKQGAGEHPVQPEALKALEAAGKTWDRKSFRKRFKEIARQRGVRVGRGVR
jgi:hypothetical protein